MAIHTTCPGCQRPLRVPDDLIGQDVKCPVCATTWTVVAPEPASGDEPPAPRPPAEEHVREVPGGVYAPIPARPPADDFDDDDEDEEFEREYDERRRRRRSRQLVADAKKKLQGPAIGLIVISSLRLVYVAVNLITTMAGVGMIAFRGAANPADFFSSFFSMAFIVLGAVLGGVALYGAVQMHRVKSYGWSLASCIVSLIPCGCCFLIDAPFAIWGIVVLNQSDVKRAFAERPGVAARREPADDEDERV